MNYFQVGDRVLVLERGCPVRHGIVTTVEVENDEPWWVLIDGDVCSCRYKDYELELESNLLALSRSLS